MVPATVDPHPSLFSLRGRDPRAAPSCVHIPGSSEPRSSPAPSSLPCAPVTTLLGPSLACPLFCGVFRQLLP